MVIGEDYQHFHPWPGLNPALPLSVPDGPCYCYPQHKVYLTNGIFKQTRSGPNWQGDLMTLTTCKQRLRTFAEPEVWPGTWIAGFTPKESFQGENYLLFLALIKWSFPSNYDLGVWLKEHHPKSYEAKLAQNDPRGDIYLPKRELAGKERWIVDNFVPPENHTRSVEYYDDGTPKWWRDIEYRGLVGRPPAVFAFDPQWTFLFSKPAAKSAKRLGRTASRYETIDNFFDTLELV